MQQLIIQTLLKYNEIFDAIQQVFQLHNYNCNDQKNLLSKYLESNQKNQTCIYVTLNENSDFFGINERFIKLQKSINSNIESLFDFNTTQFQKYVSTEISKIDIDFSNKIVHVQDDINQFKTNVDATYQTILNAKQQSKFQALTNEKINEEMDYIKHKYALKQNLDDNFTEIRDCISNVSQSISYLRNDVQLLFKNTKEMKSQTLQDTAQFNERLQSLVREVQQIDECYLQLASLSKRIEICKADVHQTQEKFKTLANMYQELEINNSKAVKFEVHSAVKKFDEDSLRIGLIQERQSGQLEQAFINLQNIIEQNVGIKSNQQSIQEQFNLEIKSLQKQISRQQKYIEQLKENISKTNQNSADLPLQMKGLSSQLQYQWKYLNQCFNLTKDSLDIIQDFCETLQVPSINQEKDLTNLILLLDRRQNELKRNLHQTPTQSSNFQSRTLMRLQTPKNSQPYDTPARIHSLQQRKCIYSKNGSQTISVDSKRETLNQN
ncbi:unnamed protein product [Paramecium octaurelia]|uniref:Uncharacterized protein n=1 Tax=Paramecium octaurelia TaxID=43137 RepID=A0A8S1X705_PAROT|nr:unnamed protein product [Paramecium octaurelia]